jgi:hypothetical protein
MSSTLPPDSDPERDREPAGISITAQGDRRAIEALYLQLRELAEQRGLKIEYRLSLSKPVDQPES